MRIYLIGYMGSGKSTVSKRLARIFHLDCYDLDDLFEQRFKVSISQFFEKYDESLFRRLESQLLKETALLENAVIATGGGTPCFYDNMDWMNHLGITVFLEMSLSGIISRVKNSKKKRPILMNKSDDEMAHFVHEHLRHRNIYYSQAQIITPAESIDYQALAGKIELFLQKKND